MTRTGSSRSRPERAPGRRADGDSAMKGTVDLGGLASGTLPAKKDKPAEKP